MKEDLIPRKSLRTERKRNTFFSDNENFIRTLCETGLERRRLRSFTKHLYKLIGSQQEIFHVDEETQEKIRTYLRLVIDLLNMSEKGLHRSSKANISGLARVFFEHRIQGLPIQCFSFASNALTRRGDLKQKDQYKKFERIFINLAQLFSQYNVPFHYEVLLADIDDRYELERFSELYEENVHVIKKETRAHVRRMSQVFLDHRSWIARANHEKADYFDTTVNMLEESNTLLVFHTTKERARDQMCIYTGIGSAIEQSFPTAILFDVQKKIYPYEQPFYNKMRNDPLPIIRPNNFNV